MFLSLFLVSPAHRVAQRMQFSAQESLCCSWVRDVKVCFCLLLIRVCGIKGVRLNRWAGTAWTLVSDASLVAFHFWWKTNSFSKGSVYLRNGCHLRNRREGAGGSWVVLDELAGSGGNTGTLTLMALRVLSVKNGKSSQPSESTNVRRMKFLQN